MSEYVEKSAYVLAYIGGSNIVEAAGLVAPATWSSATGQIIAAFVLLAIAAAIRRQGQGENG